MLRFSFRHLRVLGNVYGIMHDRALPCNKQGGHITLLKDKTTLLQQLHVILMFVAIHVILKIALRLFGKYGNQQSRLIKENFALTNLVYTFC